HLERLQLLCIHYCLHLASDLLLVLLVVLLLLLHPSFDPHCSRFFLSSWRAILVSWKCCCFGSADPKVGLAVSLPSSALVSMSLQRVVQLHWMYGSLESRRIWKRGTSALGITSHAPSAALYRNCSGTRFFNGRYKEIKCSRKKRDNGL